MHSDFGKNKSLIYRKFNSTCQTIGLNTTKK